jgi:hypothetical protein
MVKVFIKVKDDKYLGMEGVYFVTLTFFNKMNNQN